MSMSPTRKDSHNVQPLLVRKFGREAGISQSIMESSYRQKYHLDLDRLACGTVR